MEELLVTVIIPTYNRARIIAETIENVFQQTYSKLELIVVDDGSTDETVEVLKSYGRRIRWAVQENAGPAAARNRGINMARGEVIAFQDSDDAWHPEKIARQVNLLERAGQGVPCCLCNMVIQLPGAVLRSFDVSALNAGIEEGIWINVAEVLATRFVMFNQAAVVRRNVLKKIGGFDESFRLMEDGEMEMRLSLEGPWAIISEPLATRQDKLPNTLGGEATAVKVGAYNVRMRENMLRLMGSDEKFSLLRELMQRELKRAERNLRAARLRENEMLGAGAVGWCLQRFERYRAGLERRLPGYPKMKVVAVDDRSQSKNVADLDV
jgi:glycosyltransferase involved in cell wall biosynthesis